MKAADVQIDDKDINCNLLIALPETFDTAVTVVENMEPDNFKYESVKLKLLAEDEKKRTEEKRKSTDMSTIGTAFLSQKCVMLVVVKKGISEKIVGLRLRKMRKSEDREEIFLINQDTVIEIKAILEVEIQEEEEVIPQILSKVNLNQMIQTMMNLMKIMFVLFLN